MSFAGDLPADGSGADYSDFGANQRSGAAQLPFMDSLAQTASHAFFGATRDIGDYLEMDQARQQAISDRQFNVDPQEDPGGALIDPKEWQAQYKDLGLTFTPDMGTNQAALLVAHRQDELNRQYVLDHSPNTFMTKTARGLTDFAVSALDPVNVAAAFVPGIGETRAGLLAAKFGKTFGRVIEGGVAGATGMAALQPLDAAEAHAYQDHYGPMDAFANVAFGAVLGGGLHAGFGAISDFLGRATDQTREGALRASVGQMVDGRPVDAEPVLATDPALAPPVKIGEVTDPRQLDSMPFIDQQDFALAGQEARLSQDVAGHDAQLADLDRRKAALPAENPDAVKRLGDLSDIHDKLLDESLTPEGRRDLLDQRDQVLTDTNPEQLQQQAQPTLDRQALADQQQAVQTRRANAAAMLEDVRSQRRQNAVLNALGPYARSAIDRARQDSLEFAAGREPGTAVLDKSASDQAAMSVRATGDDAKAELADVQDRIKAYRDQGIISDDEHAAFTQAGAEQDEALDTRSKAAEIAARCLFLHP